MIDYGPTDVDEAISPGCRYDFVVDPIEGEDEVIALTAVYRHFLPDDDRLDVHTSRFR